jgi:hypothetical protein
MNLPRYPGKVPNLGILPPGSFVSPFVHSTELVVIGDKPFVDTYSLIHSEAPGAGAFTLLQYDGTRYRCSADPSIVPSSMFWDDYDADADDVTAVAFMLAKFAALKDLVTLGAIGRDEWPWTVTAETFSGERPDGGGTVTGQAALRFTRGEPVGPGDLPQRNTPIVSIPSAIVSEIPLMLVRTFGSIFIPGEDGKAAIGVRWGMSRGIAPIALPDPHDHTRNTPYEAPPPEPT